MGGDKRTCSSYLCWCKAKPRQFKSERADTQRGLVVSLAVKESEAPAGEAHLFTPEHSRDLVRAYVCVHVSLSVCMFMCVDQAPTGAEEQK